jgi:hypothetical protein
MAPRLSFGAADRAEGAVAGTIYRVGRMYYGLG